MSEANGVNMTEQEQLLAAVRDAPDCDTTRLAYADWLGENDGTATCQACSGSGAGIRHPDNGHVWRVCDCGGTGSVSNGFADRGEFIRVQVELARHVRCCSTTAHGTDDTCRPLRNREWELRRKYGEQWLHPAPEGLKVVKGSGVQLGWAGQEVVPLRGEMIRVEFRRGFVDEVRCSHDAFAGEPCRECNGMGNVEPRWSAFNDVDPPHMEACLHCRGLGRTPGLAGPIFSAHPVTRVVLSGLEPVRHIDHGLNYDYSWVINDLGDYPRVVPQYISPDLWDRLDGFLTTPNPRTRAKRYRTRELAREALYDAARRLGRERAMGVSP